MAWSLLALAALALSIRSIGAAVADPNELLSAIPLPPFEVMGRPAKAHTQGLEIVGDQLFVTARRDDLLPKRALLLRTKWGSSRWDVWDITPEGGEMIHPALDHPGGIQSDGTHLWIPLAESKRNSRSVIRAYSLAGLIDGQPAKPAREFAVNDHIGAIAVSHNRQLLLGASWDTESIYTWDFSGRRQRTLATLDLANRELGVATVPAPRSGLAVQDWKIVGHQLFASGLFKTLSASQDRSISRLMRFPDWFGQEITHAVAFLPRQGNIELGQEAMAIAQDHAYFVPEDLGLSNRVFRVALTNLFKTDERSTGN